MCIRDRYTTLSPLDIALIMESFDSVKWLVKKGVNLNVKGNPAFLLAVRYCDEAIIRYLVEHGAKVNCVNEVKAEAFEQALYGKKYENLPLIHELGPVSYTHLDVYKRQKLICPDPSIKVPVSISYVSKSSNNF